MNSEYIRCLNKNYIRIMLDPVEDWGRYQYCILSRGGIKYLLECSLRQIDENKYLYYEISSSQNIKQIFTQKTISRQWMEEFLWTMRRLKQELERFLLEVNDVIWSPDHIFQDLEKNTFQFLYRPYQSKGEEKAEDFANLLEFFVDRIDYEDLGLVEFIYYAYDQYKILGSCYLEKKIFEDFRNVLEIKDSEKEIKTAEKERETVKKNTVPENNAADLGIYVQENERRGIRSFFGKYRKKAESDSYINELSAVMTEFAVCEEAAYAGSKREMLDVVEEYGKTIYIEEKEEFVRGLYSENGELICKIEKFPFLVGKRKEDVDFAISDYAASRVHARFVEKEDGIYIEDLNSTNGTFKNGLRMQPYESRRVESEDEIRLGKSVFIYR